MTVDTVKVPLLKDFYDGEPEWTVRGLTAEECAKAKRAVKDFRNMSAIPNELQIASDGVKLVGCTDNIERISWLVMGSVNPVCDTETAFKILEVSLPVFGELTNRIRTLTPQEYFEVNLNDDESFISEENQGMSDAEKILIDALSIAIKNHPSESEIFTDTKFNLELSLSDIGSIISAINDDTPKTKDLLALITQKMVEIEKVYNGKGRQDERARKVIKLLGLSTGKRESRRNDMAIFHEYVGLIVGEANHETFTIAEPVEKWAAIKFLSEKHNFESIGACYKFLQRYIKRQKDRCKDRGEACNFDNLLPWDDGKKYNTDK